MRQIDQSCGISRSLVDLLKTESAAVDVDGVQYMLKPTQHWTQMSEICTVAVASDGAPRVLGALYDYGDSEVGALPNGGVGAPRIFSLLGEAVAFAADVVNS